MDVSIIIVNYHSAKMVIDCINSIFEKTKNLSYEIIVVDNASNDSSVALLRETFGQKITVIAQDENLGFGKANNLGAKQAQGDYLFLLNPDTILVNDAISILVDYLRQNSECGVAGGNLYTPDMDPAPSYCMEFDDLSTEKKNSAWFNLIGSKVNQKLSVKANPLIQLRSNFNYDETVKRVGYIFGADMMIPRKLFAEIGGFDPEFFMYYEEAELSWRITQMGYEIVSVPDAKIIHLDGATTKKVNTFSEYQFRMRINGAMIYYEKRFGVGGVEQFYILRTRRYERLMKIAKVQHKLTDDFLPFIQKQILAEEYQKFIKRLEDQYG